METSIPPAKLASSRRHVWEMYADVRAVNTWLLLYSIGATIVAVILSLVIWTIFTRPPYILSEDDGFVQWRNTEVFRLREDQVKSYLWTTFGRIYNVTPGSYDLTPLLPLVSSQLIDRFTGKISSEQGDLRIETNQRQIYDLLEVRRTIDPRYPSFISILTRGVETKISETRDKAGNIVVTSPPPEVVFRIAYLQQKRPTPENPWGLYMVGIRVVKGTSAEKEWNDSVPMAGTADGRGKPILPKKQ